MDGAAAHPQWRDRVLALFEEAWQRTRRRRRLLAIGLVTVMAGLAAIVTATVVTGPRSVPARPHEAPVVELPLAGTPGIGVACPTANSIACDRVGVAVWLRGRPKLLVATIAGRSVALRLTQRRCSSCAAFYVGFVEHAGLRNGALRVRPDRGDSTWFGRHATIATLRLRAVFPGGRVAETRRRVSLAPGWG